MDEKKPDLAETNFKHERERILRALNRKGALAAGEPGQLGEEKEVRLDWESKNAALDYENRVEKRNLRRQWNVVLTALVVAGFFLSYGMIILIGLDILKFPNNAFAVPSVVAAGIVETYGLAKLAIKYFFSEDDTNDTRKK